MFLCFLSLFLPEDCSVLELYIHGVGGQRLRRTLLASAVPDGTVVFPDLLPQTLSVLLAQLYPQFTNSFCT